MKIAEAFTDADHRRGYVCVAPQRFCGVHRTITDDGVWFSPTPPGMMRSAHRECARASLMD